MIKTFVLGVVLGLAASAALLYAMPAVDLERERSIISVSPNGGNREVFHVNLPGDRIMAGRAGASRGFPDGLAWPDYAADEPSQTELFKLRNDADRVVGVASRIAAGGSTPFVEWAVHLPARGSMYVVLSASADGGSRSGALRGGTREFLSRRGAVIERFEAAVDENADGEGRLVLEAALVGRSDEAEPVAEVIE